MFRLNTQPRSPIGLDIGARRVKAVQLEPVASETADGAPRWRVAAATCINRTSPGAPLAPDEAARLCDALDRLGFAGARAAVAAPADKLFTGMLELPRVGGGQIPLEQIARVELARTQKVSPDTFEMGCWELPVPARAGKAAHVMAVGYPHVEATALLELLEHAGFDVVAMDVRSCALARACAGIVAPPPGITALVDLGWASASLVLVYSGTVVYVRTLSEAGINRIYEGFARRLRLEPDLADYLLTEVGMADPAAATAAAQDGDRRAADRITLPSEARSLLTNYADGLVRELLASFSYVARQYTDTSVTRLVLMGAGGSVPGLGEHLTKELGLETISAAPKDLAECPPALLDACSSPELTPALGLAEFPET